MYVLLHSSIIDAIIPPSIKEQCPNMTLQALPRPPQLRIQTFVNSQVRQDSNTSQFCHTIPQIIQFCSQGTTIVAGSVILTGTSSGPGFAMEPPQWLRHDDVVEIRVEKIGTLRNKVRYI